MNEQQPTLQDDDSDEDVGNLVSNISKPPPNTPFDKAQGKPFDSAQGKKLLAGIVIVLGVLVVVGAGVYFYTYKSGDIVKENEEVADTPDLATSEVEGWQTYRNEEYGFEIKYPPEYTMQETGEGGLLSVDNFDHKYIHGGIIPTNGAEIFIREIPESFSERDLIYHENTGSGGHIEEITFAGLPAKKIIYARAISPESVYYYMRVYFSYGDSLFTFSLIHSGNDFKTKFLSQFDAFLSTFKFIE